MSLQDDVLWEIEWAMNDRRDSHGIYHSVGSDDVWAAFLAGLAEMEKHGLDPSWRKRLSDEAAA
jgi:hypothetical protein